MITNPVYDRFYCKNLLIEPQNLQNTFTVAQEFKLQNFQKLSLRNKNIREFETISIEQAFITELQGRNHQ
jgi:hypothetical protein